MGKIAQNLINLLDLAEEKSWRKEQPINSRIRESKKLKKGQLGADIVPEIASKLKVNAKFKMGKIESKEKIYWVNDVEKAVLIAGLTRKPVFLMILKSFCPTCKVLEPEYVQDKDFRILSRFFVMARSIDQKQVEETYALDGHYVPRILFLDSEGKPMEQFFNETAPKPSSKYFYPQAEEVVNTMRNVLYHFYSFRKQEN